MFLGRSFATWRLDESQCYFFERETVLLLVATFFGSKLGVEGGWFAWRSRDWEINIPLFSACLSSAFLIHEAVR